MNNEELLERKESEYQLGTIVDGRVYGNIHEGSEDKNKNDNTKNNSNTKKEESHEVEGGVKRIEMKQKPNASPQQKEKFVTDTNTDNYNIMFNSQRSISRTSFRKKLSTKVDNKINLEAENIMINKRDEIQDAYFSPDSKLASREDNNRNEPSALKNENNKNSSEVVKSAERENKNEVVQNIEDDFGRDDEFVDIREKNVEKEKTKPIVKNNFDAIEIDNIAKDLEDTKSNGENKLVSPENQNAEKQSVFSQNNENNQLLASMNKGDAELSLDRSKHEDNGENGENGENNNKYDHEFN